MCVLKDGVAVSVRYYGCVFDVLVEIEVSTDLHHRELGIASIEVKEVVKLCQSRELQPTWDWFCSNVASLSLAERSGFCSIIILERLRKLCSV